MVFGVIFSHDFPMQVIEWSQKIVDFAKVMQTNKEGENIEKSTKNREVLKNVKNKKMGVSIAKVGGSSPSWRTRKRC